MSDIGIRDTKQYEADFPLDFGLNVRGSLLHSKSNEPIGILMVHRLPDNGTCGGACYWDKSWTSRGTGLPTWELKNLEPLHLEPSIKCSCGFHGWIRKGKWSFADDSPHKDLHRG